MAVKFSASVISVAPVSLTDGTVGVAIAFGVPIVTFPKPKDDGKNVVTVQIPTQQNMPQPTHSIRFVMYLSEQEWQNLSCKPVYGDSFIFESNKDGFIIKSDGK